MYTLTSNLPTNLPTLIFHPRPFNLISACDIDFEVDIEITSDPHNDEEHTITNCQLTGVRLGTVLKMIFKEDLSTKHPQILDWMLDAGFGDTSLYTLYVEYRWSEPHSVSVYVPASKIDSLVSHAIKQGMVCEVKGELLKELVDAYITLSQN